MERIPGHDRYLEPPHHRICDSCEIEDCNGIVDGYDGDGRIVEEKCPCKCHVDPMELKMMESEFLWELNHGK